MHCYCNCAVCILNVTLQNDSIREIWISILRSRWSSDVSLFLCGRSDNKNVIFSPASVICRKHFTSSVPTFGCHDFYRESSCERTKSHFVLKKVPMKSLSLTPCFLSFCLSFSHRESEIVIIALKFHVHYNCRHKRETGEHLFL